MPSSPTPGSSNIAQSNSAMPTWSSPQANRLDAPNIPAIRFTRGLNFVASLVHSCYGLSGCSPPLVGSDQDPLPATGGFYFQASDGSVALPAAGYDYDIDWTPMSAGLAPAGTAASFAALARMSPRAAPPAHARGRHAGYGWDDGGGNHDRSERAATPIPSCC
jgi:hypothetical protein